MFTEKAFIAAVKESFQIFRKIWKDKKDENINQQGKKTDEEKASAEARKSAVCTPGRHKPILCYCVEEMKLIWGKNFDVHYFGNNEEKNQKNSQFDITVKNNTGEAVFCLDITCVMSNFTQNSSNYCTKMVGKAKLMRDQGVCYAHLFVIPLNPPYFKNGKDKPDHYEKIKDQHIEKYLNLVNKEPHISFALGIQIINVNELVYDISRRMGKISPLDIEVSKVFKNTDVKNGLKNELSLSNLFKKIGQYKKEYCKKQKHG